jgi:Zn-dependent protease with chaperone function
VSAPPQSKDPRAADDTSLESPKDARRNRYEREDWRLKLPAAPLILSDDHLLEYRHPAEYLRLFLALGVMLILLVAAIWMRERDILIALGAIYLSMLGSSTQAATLNTLEGAEVTPTQFADIYQMVEKLRERFHAPPMRVFVVRRQTFAAQPLGIKAPYVIVLPHALIDALEPQELAYEIGQALGHICFGHTRMALLLGGDGAQLPALLSWIARIRDLIFAGYWRAQVLSADRAGVLACGGIATAIQARIKLSVGSNQALEVRGDDLIEQAFKLTQGMTRMHAAMIHWQSSTPPFIHRLEAMVEWAGLPRGESDPPARP